MDKPVDKKSPCFACGTFIFRPQFSVYDISRTAPEIFGVFHSFPSLYYEYDFLSFLIERFLSF